MQWLAMTSMLIDHIGIAFYPDDPSWRIVGRLAFPIYAYYFAQGLSRTRSRPKYFTRLSALAAASQIPYTLTLDMKMVNVVGSFLVIASAVMLAERIQNGSGRILTMAVAAAILELVPFDYGAYGLALVLIYRHLSGWSMAAAHAVLNFLAAILYGWILQIVSIIPTLLISAKKDNGHRVPAWLWRSFYPVHLCALYFATFIF